MLANGALVNPSQGGSAWHCGTDSSVVNNPLGEPDGTPLYVGLLFVWGSMDGDIIFPIL